MAMCLSPVITCFIPYELYYTIMMKYLKFLALFFTVSLAGCSPSHDNNPHKTVTTPVKNFDDPKYQRLFNSISSN